MNVELGKPPLTFRRSHLSKVGVSPFFPYYKIKFYVKSNYYLQVGTKFKPLTVFYAKEASKVKWRQKCVEAFDWFVISLKKWQLRIRTTSIIAVPDEKENTDVGCPTWSKLMPNIWPVDQCSRGCQGLVRRLIFSVILKRMLMSSFIGKKWVLQGVPRPFFNFGEAYNREFNLLKFEKWNLMQDWIC